MREDKNVVINLEIFNLSHWTRIPSTKQLEYYQRPVVVKFPIFYCAMVMVRLMVDPILIIITTGLIVVSSQAVITDPPDLAGSASSAVSESCSQNHLSGWRKSTLSPGYFWPRWKLFTFGTFCNAWFSCLRIKAARDLVEVPTSNDPKSFSKTFKWLNPHPSSSS